MSSPLPPAIAHLTLSDVKRHLRHGRTDDPLILRHRTVIAVTIASIPLIVKFGTTVSVNEASITRFVAARTSVPVPTIYHTFHDTSMGRAHPITYIVESRLPGATLRSALPTVTAAEQHTLARDLAGIMAQLAALSAHRTTLGPMEGPWRNAYFRDFLAEYPCGIDDARTTEDFLRYFLRIEGYRDRREPPKTIAESLRTFDLQRPPLFSHGNMGPTHILVSGGHVVGIVDWAEAGWYPYFWDEFVAAQAIWLITKEEEKAKWAEISPNIPLRFCDEYDAFKKIWGCSLYYI